MVMEPPYDEFKELNGRITEWWAEHGKNRERIGELILRLGMREFLEAAELPPAPQQVRIPRANPFFFWNQSDFEAEGKGRKYYTRKGFSGK
jgi:sulfite reductase alpha subunit